MSDTPAISAGQKCILSKWQRAGKDRRPTPVVVVAHHSGEVWIVRETETGEEYPAMAVANGVKRRDPALRNCRVD